MMPTIGCEEGTLFSSLSVAGGCGTATSCAGILFGTDVFAKTSACSTPFSQMVAIIDNYKRIGNSTTGTNREKTERCHSAFLGYL